MNDPISNCDCRFCSPEKRTSDTKSQELLIRMYNKAKEGCFHVNGHNCYATMTLQSIIDILKKEIK
jgi:hypothetical protein